MPTRFFDWSAEGCAFAVACHTLGPGPPVLFLPAMSTVSSRLEWQAVAAELADQFTATLVDWPGFGASSRPQAAYSPTLYEAFLRDFVRSQFDRPIAVVAAGHAAGYVLRIAAAGDPCWSRAVLAAPTWRGPLPTAMGEHRRFYALLGALVACPGLGQALYHINTSRWFLQRMYGRHVFVDVRRLGPSFVLEKQRLARQRGARFAAAAFVTGALDPFADRDSCCRAMRSATFPLLLVTGKQTPPKSAAEMAALAATCAKPPLYVPGSLGLHEECAEAISTPIRLFLAGQP